MMKLRIATDVPEDHPCTAGMRDRFQVVVVNRLLRDENVPISSMTGFASNDGQTGDSDWRWDVKSVNARGLDLRFRLPPGYEALEPKLRAAAQSVLKRGSVAIGLNVRFQSAVGRTALDDEALTRMVVHIKQVRAKLESAGIPLGASRAEAILAMPGVMVLSDTSDTQDVTAQFGDLLVGFEDTLQALLTERRSEGSRLARVISEQVTQIESLTRDAAGCAEEAVLALRERLQTQLTMLLSDPKFAPDRLEQEAALLASKADIREEIDRLYAHVAAARELLSLDEPIGRRLDFLTQEFNREANTLCSKSSTDTLTRIGLDLKMVVDQIKEQAANVE
jgi:uncharacterized protein (TIGR00255 family)